MVSIGVSPNHAEGATWPRIRCFVPVEALMAPTSAAASAAALIGVDDRMMGKAVSIRYVSLLTLIDSATA
jgi:hypothetical protein